MTYLKTTTCGALCALCTTPALSQEVLELDTITVSGSLIPTEIARTGASVEVIDGQDVAISDTQLTDRLDRLPGVSSVGNGPLGTSTSIRVRGLPGQYVGVRINGIDVTDPSSTQTQFNFGGLTGAGLGRVEVLKGSQSALYGSEAIGGVVDISTWQPTRDGVSGNVRAEAGSFDTYTGELNLGYRGARGSVALSYSHIESDGFSAKAADAEDDGFEQDLITGSGEYDLSDGLTLGGSVFYRDKESEYDPSSDPDGLIPSEEIGVRGFARFQTGAIDHEIYYTSFEIERRFRVAGSVTSRSEGDRDVFGYLGSADIGTAGTLTFGLDYTDESFKSLPSRGSNDNLAVKAEWLLPVGDTVDLSMALRHDEDGDFGGKTTGRVAAVWRPAEDWTLRAVAGTGFRAPSLFERFSTLYGDPGLKPEESESYEFGVERQFENGRLRATVFRIDIDDLIDFDFGAGGYLQVPGTSVSKGVELTGEADINPFLSIYANYTYTSTEEADGRQRPRVPKHDAVLGLEADLSPRLQGRFDVRHVADVRASAFAPANNKVGDYTLVGARLNYAVTNDTSAYLRVENLFDEDYETAGGFNTSGRAAYAGLRASF